MIRWAPSGRVRPRCSLTATGRPSTRSTGIRTTSWSVARFGDHVVGVLQITFLPSLTYQGAWRAMVEGVRVDSSARAGGIGRKLLGWAIERARQRGCCMVQLTSDKSRPDAIRFYQGLGFVASHEGMKLHLCTPSGGT